MSASVKHKSYFRRGAAFFENFSVGQITTFRPIILTDDFNVVVVFQLLNLSIVSIKQILLVQVCD